MLNRKETEYGLLIQGQFTVKVHHLTGKWPKSGSFTEKIHHKFDNFHKAIWEPVESSWSKGSKNTHVVWK